MSLKFRRHIKTVWWSFVVPHTLCICTKYSEKNTDQFQYS